MPNAFIEFKPQPTIPIRTQYIDLISESAVVLNNLELLSKQLQMTLDNKKIFYPNLKPNPVSRASDLIVQERLDELKNHTAKFRTTQIAKFHVQSEIHQALEGLALHMQNSGIYFIKPGLIDIPGVCRLYYDNECVITLTEPNLDWHGLNALEVIAGFCAQDFGLVIERDAKLIYLYGSARYEKTPKHVENGYDYFLGEDFLEWHRRIPLWGPKLADFFERLYLVFKKNALDALIIDLRGRNLYTDGKIVVRRYERDYALPLRSSTGKLTGMIVFADTLFKNINEELRPFFGGMHLVIDSPREFNQKFQIIAHAAFHHHPYGMRDKNGKSPSTP